MRTSPSLSGPGLPQAQPRHPRATEHHLLPKQEKPCPASVRRSERRPHQRGGRGWGEELSREEGEVPGVGLPG